VERIPGATGKKHPKYQENNKRSGPDMQTLSNPCYNALKMWIPFFRPKGKNAGHKKTAPASKMGTMDAFGPYPVFGGNLGDQQTGWSVLPQVPQKRIGNLQIRSADTFDRWNPFPCRIHPAGFTLL
jgi:hypothetical protein